MAAPTWIACAPDFRIGQVRAFERKRAPTLLVFITGVFDTTDDVRLHGVIEVVRKAAGPVDTIIVDHETPSFRADEFTEEFQKRIVQTANFRAYDQHVLLGFSSGGTAALTYTSRQPTSFETLILYAPYLGPMYIIDEIQEAGGLAAWKPEGPIEGQELLWAWLRDYRVDDRDKPSLYVLWSADDEAVPGLPFFRELLPRDRLIIGLGKHGWEAFDPLWRKFVPMHPNAFKPKRGA